LCLTIAFVRIAEDNMDGGGVDDDDDTQSDGSDYHRNYYSPHEIRCMMDRSSEEFWLESK
jgi:hypothetical protein